jgi:oligopeptide/dipeptide ABC transporter ATP-binding protein
MDNLLTLKDIVKYFPSRGSIFGHSGGVVKAVDGVSFSVGSGETFGLVGESGCGKSTLARIIARLMDPTSGQIIFDNRDITVLHAKDLRPLRRDMQIIFQDPYASLNPRMKVGEIIGEALAIHNIASGHKRNKVVKGLIEKVGLSGDSYNRYPHEFSGGQRQRVCIARVLALNPRLIIADEPLSALDVSIQAQIINLLEDLQREFNLTYLFISHDLGVVEYISDRVAVMYLGKIMEIASAEGLYSKPVNPYTEALLSAIPVPDPKVRKKRIMIGGDMPSPLNPPSGCRFHTRCIYAQELCAKEEPKLLPVEGHLSACHFPLVNLPSTRKSIPGTSEGIYEETQDIPDRR